jgi:hypothetical protein
MNFFCDFQNTKGLFILEKAGLPNRSSNGETLHVLSVR